MHRGGGFVSLKESKYEIKALFQFSEWDFISTETSRDLYGETLLNTEIFWRKGTISGKKVNLHNFNSALILRVESGKGKKQVPTF